MRVYPRALRLCSPLALLGMVLTLSACPDDIELVDTYANGCDARPVFNLFSPGQGEVVTGNTLQVEIEVGNFNLVDRLGGASAPCEGHFHAWIDDVQRTATADTTFELALGDLEEGEHVFMLTVHNNDHSRIESIPAIVRDFTYAPGGLVGDDPRVTAEVSPGHVEAGDVLTVDVAVENFALVDFESSTEDRPGEGHYHIYLDEATGADYRVADFRSTTVVEVPGETEPGDHELRVSLRNNLHGELSPPVDDRVGFAVVEALPEVSAEVGSTEVEAGGTLAVTVFVGNFELMDFEDNEGGVVFGEGHYHIYIDDHTGEDFLARDFRSAVDVVIPANTTAGAHTLRVSLRNHDHSELDPPIEDVVDITVLE